METVFPHPSPIYLVSRFRLRLRDMRENNKNERRRKKVMVERSWTRVFHCERLSKSDQASLTRFQALFHRIFSVRIDPEKLAWASTSNGTSSGWNGIGDRTRSTARYSTTWRHDTVVWQTEETKRSTSRSMIGSKNYWQHGPVELDVSFFCFSSPISEFLFFPRPNFYNGYAAAGQKLAAQLATLLVAKQVFLKVSA